MFDTIMNDYSDMDVKKSFNIPTENPFNRLWYKLNYIQKN
jgi:hypothetical protein